MNELNENRIARLTIAGEVDIDGKMVLTPKEGDWRLLEEEERGQMRGFESYGLRQGVVILS